MWRRSESCGDDWLRPNLQSDRLKTVIGAETTFVGHQVGCGTSAPLEENLRKVRNASRPLTKKDVRSFLGLTGYYRKFVPNYAAIAVPFTDATRKGQPNQVIWGDAQEKAYTTMKAVRTSHPILHLPDHSKPFFLQTDASEIGIGAVLIQQHGGKLFPVTYISNKLTEREKRFSTIENVWRSSGV